MMNEYLGMLPVMIEILLLVGVGWLARRLHLIDAQSLRSLSGLTVGIFLPCLIVQNILTQHNLFSLAYWWLYPLLGILVSTVGAGVGFLLTRVAGIHHGRRYVISMLAFQNCGYLPLVLAQRIYEPAVAAPLITAIFLFIQGFNLLFFTLGVRYLNQAPLSSRQRGVVIMPLVALIAAGILRLTQTEAAVPPSLLSAAEMLGRCTVPLALVSLGAAMTRRQESEKFRIAWLGWVSAVKMLLMPILGLLVVRGVPMPPVMATLLLIQCAMPTAINLSVFAQLTCPDGALVHRGVVLMHFIGLITIPVFLSILR